MSAKQQKQQKEEPAAPAPQSDAGDDKKKKRPARGPKVDGVKRKRGPPRPHRKLTQLVLDSRISKLNKRIEKARGHLEDAERHIDGYSKEAKYREVEQPTLDAQSGSS